MNYRRHFAFFILLSCLFTIISCRQSNKQGTEESVDFKRTDNTVIVRALNDADVLNPLMTTINTSRMVADQVFQLLLYVDPETLQLIPELADSLPIATDIEEGPFKGGVKYTFTIHESAVWSDGSPVTAEDYLFSVKALLIPGVGNPALRNAAASLKDVRIDPTNPKKLDVYFNQKHFQAEAIAGNLIHVLPKSIYDPDGLLDNIALSDITDIEKASGLVDANPELKKFVESINTPEYTREVITGSGPYFLEEWVAGQRIVLRKKENWWGQKLADKHPGLLAYPDQIIFSPIPEDFTAITALKAEEMDVVIRIPPADFIEMQEQKEVLSKYNLFTSEQLAYYFLYVNTSSPKLSDKRVRKALAHAIDVDAIIEGVYNGFGKRTASPVSPSSPDYNKALEPVAFSPELARRLLEEAGWKDSNNNGIADKEINGTITELSLEYGHSANSSSSEAVALLVKDYAQQVGIDLRLVPTEMTQGMARVNNKDYELFSGGLQQLTTWTPRQHWHSEGHNRMSFATAYTDSLIERSEIAGPDERRKIYHELQQIIYEEQPMILLMVPQNRIAIHKRFETPITPIYPGYFPNLVRIRKD